MSGRREHWESVYQTKGRQQTSWFRPHLDESLRMIDALAPDRRLPVIDIGGGRATLVDDLLARGHDDVSVLDLSEAALAESRDRLGSRGDAVHWIAGDITTIELPVAHYGLWHDRAVFHFLDEAAQRRRYAALARRAVRPGGHLVIATFAPDGPEKCSGLPVCRYDADGLAAQFAEGFEPIADSRETHRTPFGSEQSFTYVALRRRDDHTSA